MDETTPDPGFPEPVAAAPTPAPVGRPRPEDHLRLRRLRTLEELIDDVLRLDD